MIKYALLFIFSTLFALLLCEGILQFADYPTDDFCPWIADNITAYRSAPNLDQRMICEDFDVRIKTNELGLRDDPVGEKKGFRILMLGDSYAFGYGADRSFLFVDLLEQKLQTEIINAAVGGFEIIHQVKWFAAEGKQFDADLVIFALYLGNDLAFNGLWREDAETGLVNPKKRFLVRTKNTSKIKQLLRILYRVEFNPLRPKEWVPPPEYLEMTRKQLSPENELNYAETKKWLGELRDEVVESGAEFFVFLLPYKTVVEPPARERFMATIPGFREQYDLERPANELEAFCGENQIACLNLVPAMNEYYKTPSNPSLFYYSEGHFTPEGNAFVSAQLEPAVSSLIDRIKAENPADGN